MASLASHRSVAGLASLQALRNPPPRPLPSPTEVAAAHASGIADLAARANAVAGALTLLLGEVPRGALLDGLARAGFGPASAGREMARMSAAGLLDEPRPGYYRALGT